jgi:hypothetical protein
MELAAAFGVNFVFIKALSLVLKARILYPPKAKGSLSQARLKKVGPVSVTCKFSGASTLQVNTAVVEAEANEYTNGKGVALMQVEAIKQSRKVIFFTDMTQCVYFVKLRGKTNMR